MKIATWNVERLIKNKNQSVLDCLKIVDADILILTETSSVINPKNNYSAMAADELINDANVEKGYYKAGENRTTIWSKFPFTTQLKTYDNFTAVCNEIQTPLGKLIVYGTVIGIHGNRRESFKVDLEKQMTDWKTICEKGSICIAGDFNISFSDNYYFTNEGREKLNSFFSQNELINTTEKIPQNIDHIVISKSFLENKNYKVLPTWNDDKKLSDHIGVCIEINL
ncbi:MAG: hypothetical protein RL708_724 [Bacteroidota bacterium]|jgi:exonuclease III